VGTFSFDSIYYGWLQIFVLFVCNLVRAKNGFFGYNRK
jgi:hypothetical protein